MALTPVELRHLRFSRRPLGYRRALVDRALAEVADAYEDVWRDRADLADRLEQLEAELVRHRELEGLLRTTLVSAERAAQELKEGARREADLVLQEAHAAAREITRVAAAERERLAAETRRIRALLRSALEAVGEQPDAGPEGDDERRGLEDTATWRVA